MSTTDPLIGKRLGDYLIEGVLGAGGMARVYRGYDDNLDRYAAIKVIEPQLIASAEEEEYRERFLREARAIARLSHPRIVSVYQFNQVGNLYYIAMEYVEGRNLHDILKSYFKQKKLIPTADIIKILRDVADGLDYAHQQSIIHRDVKPSNIIVTDAGNAILTDFGLALNAVEGTIGNTFGSVHYIAPEQAISSAQAVPQSDLYSLGIVAYEALTGRVPFDDASAMSVALKHISDPPPPPTDINPDIPIEVEQVLLRALDKDVHKRHETLTVFVQALEMAFEMDSGTVSLPSEKPLPTTPVPPPNHGASKQSLTTDEVATARIETPQPMMSPPQTHADGSGRGMFVGGALIVIVVLIAAGLFFSGALGPDIEATETQEALVALQQTSTHDALATSDAIMLATNEAATASAQETNDASTEMAVQQTSDAATEIAQQTSDAATEMAQQTSDAATEMAQHTSDAATLIAQQTNEVATIHAVETNAAATVIAQQTNDAATEMAAATATKLAEPTATNTPVPPTPTPQPPTATPTPMATPTLDLVLSSENDPVQVLLRYDGRLFIIGNRDPINPLNLGDLVFVRFEPDEKTGEPVETERFRMAARFRNEVRDTRPGRCFQVLDTNEFRGLPTNNPLAEGLCTSAPFWVTVTEPFWVSDNPEAYFEVRLGPVDVLTVCPVNRPLTRMEQRCGVDLNALR